MREIVIKGREKLAEEYLKRVLMQIGKRNELMAGIMIKYAKIVRKYYKQGAAESLRAIDFMIEQLKRASVAVAEEFFQNLSTYVQVNVEAKE